MHTCLQEAEVFQEDKPDSGFIHFWRTGAAQDGEAAIKADTASFMWHRHSAGPNLHRISLKAIKGQLVMVVGVVGSGKSSLLAALLGEMHSRGGKMAVSSRSCTKFRGSLALQDIEAGANRSFCIQ